MTDSFAGTTAAAATRASDKIVPCKTRTALHVPQGSQSAPQISTHTLDEIYALAAFPADDDERAEIRMQCAAIKQSAVKCAASPAQLVKRREQGIGKDYAQIYIYIYIYMQSNIQYIHIHTYIFIYTYNLCTYKSPPRSFTELQRWVAGPNPPSSPRKRSPSQVLCWTTMEGFTKSSSMCCGIFLNLPSHVSVIMHKPGLLHGRAYYSTFQLLVRFRFA